MQSIAQINGWSDLFITRIILWICKVQLGLCLINKVPNHENILGNGSIAELFLTLAPDVGE
jgi:hypothetical protein